MNGSIFQPSNPPSSDDDEKKHPKEKEKKKMENFPANDEGRKQ
jgi:hypothetical protein